MTKTFFKLALCSVVSLFALSNCHKSSPDNQCTSYGSISVTSVSGPDSGFVNQPVDFNVVCGVCGCGHFDHFGQTVNGDTITVSANLKYVGCVCPQDCELLDTVFQFKAAQAGTYYIKFPKNGNGWQIDTLVVQ
jgi:hypothetical protein